MIEPDFPNQKKVSVLKCICTGAAEPGGSGGVGPPLELEIYLVNFFENSQKKIFY